MQLDAKKKWWIAGGAVLAVVLTVFAVGVYRFGWNGPVTRVLTKFLPYPAAIVDGRVIRYADFQDDVGVLQRFYDIERQKSPSAALPGDDEIRTRVLDRMMKDELAKDLAARYGISVSDADVDKAYEAAVVGAAGGSTLDRAQVEAKAEQTLRDLYGLTPSEFKAKVLMPFLIRQKLEEKIAADEALNAEKLKKAQDAVDELRAGKTFKDVAVTYGEEPSTVSTGGDRGWVGRGLLPTEVEAAAFALKPGETSDVVKSPLGYHVLQVSDRKIGADGKVVSVALHEIIIHPVQIDDYLAAQLKNVPVVTFVH